MGGSDQTVWLTSVIAITTVVLGPPVSQAADYWGRKWFLVILTSFGAVGAIIVSRATSVSIHRTLTLLKMADVVESYY